MAVSDITDELKQLADKAPPHDLEAEQATLGAMLIEPGATARAMAIVEEEDFYPEAHRLIFRAMSAVVQRNEPVDLVTVSAELRRTDHLEAVGGGDYLTALISKVPTAAHVTRYADIVVEKSLLRKLIRAGADIQGMAYEDPEDVGEVLDRAEQSIFEVAQRRISADFVPVGPLVTETFEKLDRIFRQPGYLTGVPTGLKELDKRTAGLQNGDLIIVAGRPSMGKTSMAVANFALHAAVQHQVGVGIFSLEMSRSQLAELLLCAQARVNGWALRQGMAREEDWSNIGQALTYLPQAPIYVDDTPAIPILELRSKARRLKSQYDIGLIIVDYLQLISAGSRYTGDSRHQEVSLVARSLKALARELDIPVVVLSQLSRRVEQREDKRPILSDLAESGSIEAEADLVCFLYRPAYYQRKRSQEWEEDEAEPSVVDFTQPDPAEIIIAKHRNGPVGTVDVIFHPAYRLFFDTAQHRSDGDR